MRSAAAIMDEVDAREDRRTGEHATAATAATRLETNARVIFFGSLKP